jgi:DNA-binding NarL/FixJ family response regulator
MIKIMIVEDNSIVNMELKYTISKLNYNVVAQAYNYEGAINQYKATKPNLIFLDINLGEKSKNGIEVAKAIKELDPNINIVFLTAYTDNKTMIEALEVLPKGFLNKPFKEAIIKKTLEKF